MAIQAKRRRKFCGRSCRIFYCFWFGLFNFLKPNTTPQLKQKMSSVHNITEEQLKLAEENIEVGVIRGCLMIKAWKIINKHIEDKEERFHLFSILSAASGVCKSREFFEAIEERMDEEKAKSMPAVVILREHEHNIPGVSGKMVQLHKA
jgi:hypothetical protein